MSPRLAATTAVYALGLGVAATVAAARGGARTPRLVAAVAVLELAAVAQALLDVVGLASGHHPAERATHVGYVAASLLILPVVLSSAPPTSRPGRWESATIAVGCAGLAVVALRLRATWAT